MHSFQFILSNSFIPIHSNSFNSFNSFIPIHSFQFTPIHSFQFIQETPGSVPGALPLYTEEWMEELLSRIFIVITNLDAPDASAEHGGREDGHSDSSTFLLEGTSMFRPFMELLYMRLPPNLRSMAIRRTAQFLLENTFSSVTSEAAILCNAVAWADPEQAAQLLLLPLLTALEKDAAAAKAEHTESSSRLSRVAETALKWRLSLLSSTAYRLGPELVPYGPRIRALLANMADAKSQAVQEATARALASVLQGLCAYYPLEQCAASKARLQPASVEEGCMAIEAYIDMGGGVMKNSTTTEAGAGAASGRSGGMLWHIPNSEEISLTNLLLQDFVAGPANFLLAATTAAAAAAAGGGGGATTEPPSKETIRSQLFMLEGSLGGVRSCLPDFPGCSADTVQNPVSIIGALGPEVGSSGLRVLVAEALLAVSHVIAPSDSETLFLCLRCMDLIVAAGDAEHRDSSASASSWSSDERWMHEPAVAGLLLHSLADISMSHTTTGGISSKESTASQKDQKNGGSGSNCNSGGKWRRRRPMWVAQEKVFLNMEWRASQAAYRWYPSTTTPVLPLTAIPKVYIALVARSVHFMLQGMRGVREVAAMAVERALKRYPVLTPSLVAPMLCGIAKVERGLSFDVEVTATDEVVVALLREAAVTAAATAAAGETGMCQCLLMIN